jgi:hypothetical protein
MSAISCCAPAAPAATRAAAGLGTTTLVSRPPRLPRRRWRRIEKVPPRFGEKPYEQLVADAFEGPVLRLSRRLELLERADERHIRRGDALDLIAAIQREREEIEGVEPENRARMFLRRFIAFAAVYVVVALAWCLVVSA